MVLALIPDEVSQLGCYKLQQMMQCGTVEPPGSRVMGAGRRPLTLTRRQRLIISSIIPESFLLNETNSAFTNQMLHHFAVRREKRKLMAAILTNELRLCSRTLALRPVWRLFVTVQQNRMLASNFRTVCGGNIV